MGIIKNQVPKLLSHLLFALILIAVDWFSKSYFLGLLGREGNSIPVIEGFFSWTLLFNKGSAFSLLADYDGWTIYFFVGLTVLVCSILGYRIVARRERLVVNVAFTLIMSGAIGNAINRLEYGHVIDFIHFYFGEYSYPIFNIADSLVFVGVVIVLIWGRS